MICITVSQLKLWIPLIKKVPNWTLPEVTVYGGDRAPTRGVGLTGSAQLSGQASARPFCTAAAPPAALSALGSRV